MAVFFFFLKNLNPPPWRVTDKRLGQIWGVLHFPTRPGTGNSQLIGQFLPPSGIDTVYTGAVPCRANTPPSLPRAAFPSFFNLYSYPLNTLKLNFFQVFKFHFQYFLGGKTPLPSQSCFSPTPFPFFFNLHSNPKFPIQLNFFQFFDFHFQYFFPRAA